MKINHPRFSGIVLLFVSVAALLAGLTIGCIVFDSKSVGQEQAGTFASATGQVQTWTCSMHPQIRQDLAGKCPLCGMALIRVTKAADSDSGPRRLQLSESAVALAGIQTSKVERRYPGKNLRLVGLLDYDETRVRSLTARFPARIDQLYVNFVGSSVIEGQHLARIYSPELMSAEQEFLLAQHSAPDTAVARMAREKLLLWDLLPSQIDDLQRKGEVSDSFELHAPIGGVVIEKTVREGDYVKTGEPLFRIADLSELWLHLQAYESDYSLLRYGQTLTFTVNAWPGERFHGRIAFISPQVDPKTRTIAVRVNVSNEDARLKPGMYATGQLEVKLAAGNRVFAPDLEGKWISPMHPEIIKDGPGSCDVCGMDLVPASSLGYGTTELLEAPLLVPSSAVLRTGTRALVYVQVPGEKTPEFEGREVIAGLDASGMTLIEAGLREGETVATKGAFKIDSALQILAKPSMMSPDTTRAAANENIGTAAKHTKGSAPGAPHLHSAMPDVSTSSVDEALSMLPGYLQLQKALALDDLKGSLTALSLMQAAKPHGKLHMLVQPLLQAESLDSIRDPAFSQLSTALIETLKQDKSRIPGTLVRMHCPMAGEGGADWLQDSRDLKNPYFGADMLTCGEVLETLH